MKKIVIFASGRGSNAQNIIDYFAAGALAEVSLVVSNKPDAQVLQVAAARQIKTLVIARKAFYETQQIIEQLGNPDLIVLAGFLWLLPQYLIQNFSKKIINIHPSLLPKFGGKGMYGNHIHTAVVAAGESETGITIHWVNEKYDEGEIIFQKKCTLQTSDTAADVAQKIAVLEQQHFPQIIEKILYLN